MVMYELYERLHHYSQFHQGSNQQLISDAKRFFKKKEYRLDVVDVCTVAIANALQVNPAIFEKVNGEAILINHQCTTANTNKTIYLKYSHDPEGKHLGNHYDAIVNIEIPTEEVQSGQQSEERSEVQDCQINTSEENNTSNSKQTEYREEKRGRKRRNMRNTH